MVRNCDCPSIFRQPQDQETEYRSISRFVWFRPFWDYGFYRSAIARTASVVALGLQDCVRRIHSLVPLHLYRMGSIQFQRSVSHFWTVLSCRLSWCHLPPAIPLSVMEKSQRAHGPNPYKLALGLLKHPDRQLSGAGHAGRWA